MQADREPMPATHDQAHSHRDQTYSGRDQTYSDRDQEASDLDQLAADEDQAASDRELTRGLDPGIHNEGRLARSRTTRRRSETSRDRRHNGVQRDENARLRDLAARARDAAALARDRQADDEDAELAGMLDAPPAISGLQIIARAAYYRERAIAARERAATYREQAASDREQAARDREAAADDRAAAAAERHALALDALTGTWRRDPGLKELEHEIERARRGDGQLVVAYIDVDGLKATNDRSGHSAGDALLVHVVETIRSQLRPYELMVRMGGDEFVCALSGAKLGDVRRRFAEIGRQLERSTSPGAITVGFAELSLRDSPMDLVERADQDFLVAHRARLGGPDLPPM